MSSINLKRWSRLAGLLTENTDMADPYEMDGMDEYGNQLPSDNFEDFENDDSSSNSGDPIEQAMFDTAEQIELNKGTLENVSPEEFLEEFIESNPVEEIIDGEGRVIVGITSSGEVVYADDTIQESFRDTFIPRPDGRISSLMGMDDLGFDPRATAEWLLNNSYTTCGFSSIGSTHGGGPGSASMAIRDMVNNALVPDSELPQAERDNPAFKSGKTTATGAAINFNQEISDAGKGGTSGSGGAGGQAAVKFHIINMFKSVGVTCRNGADIDTAKIGSHIPDVLLKHSFISKLKPNRSGLTTQIVQGLKSLSGGKGIAFEVKSGNGSLDYESPSYITSGQSGKLSLSGNSTQVKAHRSKIEEKLNHAEGENPADAYYIITHLDLRSAIFYKIQNASAAVDQFFFGINFPAAGGYSGMAEQYTRATWGRRGGSVATTPSYSSSPSGDWKHGDLDVDVGLAIQETMEDQFTQMKDNPRGKGKVPSQYNEVTSELWRAIQNKSSSFWNRELGNRPTVKSTKFNQGTLAQFRACMSTCHPDGHPACTNWIRKAGKKVSVNKVQHDASPSQNITGLGRWITFTWDKMKGASTKNVRRKASFFDVQVSEWDLVCTNAIEVLIYRKNLELAAAGQPTLTPQTPNILGVIKQLATERGLNPDWYEKIPESVMEKGSLSEIPYTDAIIEAINNWKRLIRK